VQFCELSSRQSVVVICPAETAERWKRKEKLFCEVVVSLNDDDDDELRF